MSDFVDKSEILHELTALKAAVAAISIPSYDTGWINTDDWTNRHLGTTAIPKNTDSNVTHSLSAPLSDLLVKVMVSTDGTDANSFEIGTTNYDANATLQTGITYFSVDLNNITVQTGINGIMFIQNTGAFLYLDNEDWYYKIKIFKISV